MTPDDRLRAKPPTTDADAWSEGTVRAVTHCQGGVTVTVTPAGDGGEGDPAGAVDLSVTDAIYDLFTGRLDPGDVRDGDVAPGATVWYRKKG